MHAHKESCTYIVCPQGLKSPTFKAYIESYALCGLTLFSGVLSSRRSDDKSERSIYLLRGVMKLQQGKEGHSESVTRLQHSLSSGVSVHSLLLLEAGSKSLWRRESQKPICVADAHNFAEGAAGLEPHLSNSQRGGTPQLA